MPLVVREDGRYQGVAGRVVPVLSLFAGPGGCPELLAGARHRPAGGLARVPGVWWFAGHG
jgi:hypothetical protein